MQLQISLASLSLLLIGTCSAFVGTNPAGQNSPTNTYEKEGDLDTEALLAKSTFPIKPVDLIALAKEVVMIKGTGTKDGGECLADDFVFRAAFVETPKDKYIEALESFSLEDSFDLRQQFFGWTVDPLQPNRVYVFNRQEATFENAFVGVKADGRELILPPQCNHVDFNEDGKVKEFGFYTVDRAQGNTGGLGGAFGFFYGVGRPLPFPEGKPYKFSFRRSIIEKIGALFSKFSKKKSKKA
jgi:hypothetical protein